MEVKTAVPVAKLTVEEIAAFTTIQDKIRALDEQTQSMIQALAKQLTEQRRALLEWHRVQWEAVETKYGLDPSKGYGVVISTGEIVEHQTPQMVMIGMDEAMREAMRRIVAAREASGEKPN